MALMAALITLQEERVVLMAAVEARVILEEVTAHKVQ
jgi:hypothetical protein